MRGSEGAKGVHVDYVVARGILHWLSFWNEFLFALIFTGSHTPMLTVRMAQFVPTRPASSGA